MPRMPRNPVEGGIYHVYNRFARSEEVFADPEAAQHFVEMARHARRRDGFVLHAWCLMSNHYHLALKTSAVPLSRTMHALQGGFARWFNQRDRRTGPLWQSRYQARLVDDERYFDELVVYVHLNPVRTGLVGDPGDYQLCGHGELLGRARNRWSTWTGPSLASETAFVPPVAPTSGGSTLRSRAKVARRPG